MNSLFTSLVLSLGFLFGSGLLASPSIAAESDWRGPLLEAVKVCKEPLPLDQYSNSQHRVTLFREPTKGVVIFCYEDLSSGTPIKLVGKMMHRATGRQLGEHEFFRATNGKTRYSLVSIESEDASDNPRPTFFLEVVEGTRVAYRGEVRVAYPFDFWLFGKH